MKAQSVCTVKRAKKIIGGVWVFACCYTCPWLGLTTTEPIHYRGYTHVEMCTFKLSRKEYLGYFFADIVVFYLVPLLLSCVLYGLIARVLFNGQFTKCPEVCKHDNQSVDPSKSSRVQVNVNYILQLFLNYFLCMFLSLQSISVGLQSQSLRLKLLKNHFPLA